ncbi:hypothetical protein N9N41_05735 [Opitutales bacterium]|nr:hypothetical protein [Opitutales bacterium]
MKNILFSMSLLGILLNPLSAGEIWSLSDDPTDSYTINNPLPSGVTATSVQDVNAWLLSENSYDPAAVMMFDTNIGRAWAFDGTKLVNWTTLTADPAGGAYGNFLVVEDNSTNPSTFKFEGLRDDPYTGAPLVSNVYAQQVAGSKNVLIDFSLLLQSDDSGGYPPSDKASHLEFWFKSNPSSLQWEVCQGFESAAGGAPGTPSGNQKQNGAINESGGFYAIWKAGEQKPNFQTSTGKIRVMVTYDHEDPNNPGTMIQGSQWDGYEAANGPTFTLDGGNPMINYNNTEYMFFQEIDTNNIARAGSLNYNGNLYPVFQLTSVMLQNLTGTGGIPDGKYAFGGVSDYVGGPVSFKIIPVN